METFTRVLIYWSLFAAARLGNSRGLSATISSPLPLQTPETYLLKSDAGILPIAYVGSTEPIFTVPLSRPNRRPFALILMCAPTGKSA
uniref:Secreted protein n=1 Tax=Chryseobacterium endophyticum TaxID=1854762 RepID=A0AAU6WRU8_9FLAO